MQSQVYFICPNTYNSQNEIMGRKKATLTPILESIFNANQTEIIDEFQKVVPPKSEIWETIWKNDQINKQIGKKAIYTAALRWWKNSIDNAKTIRNESSDFVDISYETNPPDENESDSEYVSSTDDAPLPNDVHFSISLAHNAWETIKPIATNNQRHDQSHRTNDRVYYTFPPGLWTNILAEKIAQHRIKNPCTWAFKRAKVYPNGKKYIKLLAKCTTCKAHLTGEVSDIPTGKGIVKFKFTIRSFDEKKHLNNRKNVRIGGTKAKELFSSSKKASVLKREMTKESGSKMFEPEKGRTISENAIRAGQCRQRQLSKLSSAPLQALQFLKSSNAFGPMVHSIGADPFFVIYASANQFFLFNAYKKHNKYIKATADSTGNVAHKLSKFFSSKPYHYF